MAYSFQIIIIDCMLCSLEAALIAAIATAVELD